MKILLFCLSLIAFLPLHAQEEGPDFKISINPPIIVKLIKNRGFRGSTDWLLYKNSTSLNYTARVLCSADEGHKLIYKSQLGVVQGYSLGSDEACRDTLFLAKITSESCPLTFVLDQTNFTVKEVIFPCDPYAKNSHVISDEKAKPTIS